MTDPLDWCERTGSFAHQGDVRETFSGGNLTFDLFLNVLLEIAQETQCGVRERASHVFLEAGTDLDI